ncbi:MAG: aldose epimerase family protein [Pseudomonadota bacterium]
MREAFGHTAIGETVERLTLRGGGLTAHVLTYGATLQDLRLEGVPHPLVLGSERLEDYETHFRYVGALIGRYANRISGGYILEGKRFDLSCNENAHTCLHGGEIGADRRIWQVLQQATDSVVLGLKMADGEMGFPGNLSVEVRISLNPDTALDFEIRAQSDAVTPCSFTHHGYFNLGGSAEISRHILQVNSSSYTPLDQQKLPNGELATTRQTELDFSSPRAIANTSLDHNFCLSDRREPLRQVATLSSPTNGLSLKLETTEPGLQIYDGAHFAPETTGLNGQIIGPRGGVALEPQCWPDAPNQPGFPDPFLRPGETYRHHSRYRFERAQPHPRTQ